MTPEQAVELAQVPTAMISDALDELSIAGVLYGPKPQRLDQGRVVGRALTVRFEPRSADPDAYRFGGGVGRPLEQVLKTMRAGDFVVIDLDGSTRAAAWGGLASRLAQQRGVRGTILFGACRDVDEIRQIGYPVWALGTCPRRSRNDFTFGSIQQPIDINEVTISPGDAIVADATGVVCIPGPSLESVLEVVQTIADQEEALQVGLEQGEVSSWDQL